MSWSRFGVYKEVKYSLPERRRKKHLVRSIRHNFSK